MSALCAQADARRSSDSKLRLRRTTTLISLPVPSAVFSCPTTGVLNTQFLDVPECLLKCGPPTFAMTRTLRNDIPETLMSVLVEPSDVGAGRMVCVLDEKEARSTHGFFWVTSNRGFARRNLLLQMKRGVALGRCNASRM